MPKPKPLSGDVRPIVVDSDALKGNALGDPSARTILLYSPPGASPTDTLPMLWYLAAYTNSGASANNWKAFDENVFQRVERLIESGDMGACRVAAPDCFTRLGGNQYIDSAGVGRYQTFLIDECLAAAGRAYPTSWHAAFGKSSGAYGALAAAMDRPGAFLGIAVHAGDANFDAVYRADFGKVARTLLRDKGDAERFLKRFWNARNRAGDDFLTLMMLGLSATYDPDPDDPTRLRLPFDLETLEVDPERWKAWMAHDPVQRMPSHGEALAKLDALFLDCGTRDQFHIQFGTTRLHQLLEEMQVDHEFELFDGTHSGIDYRFDTSLPFLYHRLEGVQSEA